MNIYINHLKLSGIKNLKKQVELSFYNKTIKLPVILEETNVKAIYGANGIGKSAIIHAMDIYKNLIVKEGYLYTEEALAKLSELTNKETKTFNVIISFFVFDNVKDYLERYKHEITIKERNNAFYIESETLTNILTRTEKTLINIKEGVIKEWNFKNLPKEPFINKLDRRSVVEVYEELLMQQRTIKENSSELEPFVKLGNSIFTSTENVDKHAFYFYNLHNVGHLDKTKNQYKVSSEYTYIVDLKSLEYIKKHFKQMENFIKIFKPELESIQLDIKTDKDFIYINPYFTYNGYKVHLEFESAGIKKLTKLFTIFIVKENGGIVFIDELDANINDVFLIKLLEYFKESSIGQLVFTTHNITPMEVLSDSKHSIDFITEDKMITSWKKSGNYKASNIYQSGLIKGLPFNIYPFDFVGVFEEDE